MSFEFTHVVAAVEHGARKVGFFNTIEINNDDSLEAQQRQVLQYLVAQSAGPDHHHACFADFFLVPPGDQAQTAEPVLVHLGGRNRDLWSHTHRPPAVISGCKRRLSPSATAASARVWVS